MTAKIEKTVRRRRRRTLLALLVGVGVAVWVVRRRLTEPQAPAGGWHPLPPAPRPVPVSRVVPAAAADPAATPAAGALQALADGASPDPGYTVKGKIATKVFHVPGGAYYTRARADVWFRTADDARAAGFTERVRRHREHAQLPTGTVSP